jgi:hypothetical protein
MFGFALYFKKLLASIWTFIVSLLAITDQPRSSFVPKCTLAASLSLFTTNSSDLFSLLSGLAIAF